MTEVPFNFREIWQDGSNALLGALADGLGFGVRCGEAAWTAEDLAGLKDTQTLSPDGRVSALTLRLSDALLVTRNVRHVDGSGAIELSLSFENPSSKLSQPLTDIKALDIALTGDAGQGLTVISSGGGFANGYFPPHAYRLDQCEFTPHTADPAAWSRLFGTQGGRSSDKDLPFFFLHSEEQGCGLIVAVGWSGQWAAKVQRAARHNRFAVEVSLPDLEIALEPGERIVGPTILLCPYEGSCDDGSNALRRLIRDHYRPQLAGKAFTPPVVYDHYWNVALDFDEALLLKIADTAAEVGVEYFLLDAGWYEGCPEGKVAEADPWWSMNIAWGLGNWESADRRKFPNGLADFARRIRAKNLKFGLWFEPERVCKGTKLAREHPEWILWDRADAGSPTAKLFGQREGRRIGTLYLGHADARDWMFEVLARTIEECQLEYIRWDMNFDMLPYWQAADTPGRKGLHHLRHIQGLYTLIDRILAAYPNVIFESCAGGGYRVDLEMARRSHMIWINDYSVDPLIVRHHLQGLNRFLPGSYQYVQVTHPSSIQPDYEASDLEFRSLFAGAMGAGGRLDLWSVETRALARRNIELFKRLRGYIDQDYYLLNGQPRDLTSWSGWQFHDPIHEQGFLQTFRDRSSRASWRFSPQGLASARRYAFEDVDTGELFIVTGEEANEGVAIAQERMSTRVFSYRSVD